MVRSDPRIVGAVLVGHLALVGWRGTSCSFLSPPLPPWKEVRVSWFSALSVGTALYLPSCWGDLRKYSCQTAPRVGMNGEIWI